MIQTVTLTGKKSRSRHGRGDTKIVKLATTVARTNGEIAETRVNHSLPRLSQNLRRVHRLSLDSERVAFVAARLLAKFSDRRVLSTYCYLVRAELEELRIEEKYQCLAGRPAQRSHSVYLKFG